MHDRYLQTFNAHRGTTAVVAITIAVIGVAIVGPGGAALAAEGPAPSAVVQAIESGTLQADVISGKVTEAEVVSVAESGFDYKGTHVPGWLNLSAKDQAIAQHGADLMRKDSDVPRIENNLRSQTESSGSRGTVTFTPGAPAAGVSPGEISASAHWWNRIFRDHWLYINGGWLAWMVSVPVIYATASACAFYDLSKASCALLGAFLVSGGAKVLSSWSCVRRGLWIDVPYIWKSHCNND